MATRQEVVIYLQKVPENTLKQERQGSEVEPSSSNKKNPITSPFPIQATGRISKQGQSEAKVQANIPFRQEVRPVSKVSVNFQEVQNGKRHSHQNISCIKIRGHQMFLAMPPFQINAPQATAASTMYSNGYYPQTMTASQSSSV